MKNKIPLPRDTEAWQGPPDVFSPSFFPLCGGRSPPRNGGEHLPARALLGLRERAVFRSTNRSSVLRCVLNARAGLCAPAPRNKNALGRIFGLGLPGPQLRLPIASGDSGVGKTASQRVCSKTAAFYFLSFIMVSAPIHISNVCRCHDE